MKNVKENVGKGPYILKLIVVPADTMQRHIWNFAQTYMMEHFAKIFNG